jgi:hypothetical protein
MWDYVFIDDADLEDALQHEVVVHRLGSNFGDFLAEFKRGLLKQEGEWGKEVAEAKGNCKRGGGGEPGR